MKSNNADLFFFEELHRTVGREESFQWLLSQTTKSTSSPTRSPTRSPNRSPCRTPQVSPPSSPRARPSDVVSPPPRKYVVPEGGGIRRNRSSFCRSEMTMPTLVDEETQRSSSSSPSEPCVALSDFNNSFKGLDVQRLVSMPTCGGDVSRAGNLGLLFTDAAHSILD